MFVFSPGGIPARNHKGERLLLYLGIIDILQSYQMRKKLEHTLKAIIQDGVSATNTVCFRDLAKLNLPMVVRF
jgi:hypothetical protein